jgi:hypothetical protein
VRTATADVCAAYALKARNWAVQARFANVRIVRGHAMRVVDGPGAWRLVADDGTTVEPQPRRVPPPGSHDNPSMNTRCAS